MKKVMLITLAFCLTGCTTAKEENPVLKNNKENTVDNNIAEGYRKGDNVEVIQASGDIWLNISDPKVAWENCENVALVTIDSIDGGDNVTDTGYSFAYTYGKMTVHELYKGSMAKGKDIIYTRMGGIISYEKYYNALPEPQKQRVEILKEKGEYEQPPEYIKEVFEDDIDIEVGKTYVAYLYPNTYTAKFAGGYDICNLQAGLREVSGNYKARTGLKVYNNYTKTWDDLQTLIIE